VDPLYGGSTALWLSQLKADYRPSRQHAEHPLIGRLTLHAAALAFDHPAGGGRVAYEAALPKDMRAAINQLNRLRMT
jgi:23S rRNA-/tRNA-specific pseudouridylate synthase